MADAESVRRRTRSSGRDAFAGKRSRHSQSPRGLRPRAPRLMTLLRPSCDVGHADVSRHVVCHIPFTLVRAESWTHAILTGAESGEGVGAGALFLAVETPLLRL